MSNEDPKEMIALWFSTGLFNSRNKTVDERWTGNILLCRGSPCKWRFGLVEEGGDVTSLFEVGHTCRKLLSKLEPWVNNSDYSETTQHWTATVGKASRLDIDIATVEWHVVIKWQWWSTLRMLRKYEKNCCDTTENVWKFKNVVVEIITNIFITESRNIKNSEQNKNKQINFPLFIMPSNQYKINFFL